MRGQADHSVGLAVPFKIPNPMQNRFPGRRW
jgi:hypothetical protein